MNAKTQIAAVLTDEALDAVSGGKNERVEVTLEQYERILAKMIADAKKKQ